MAVAAYGACNNKVEVSSYRDGVGGDGASNCAMEVCSKEQQVQNLKQDFGEMLHKIQSVRVHLIVNKIFSYRHPK